MHRMIAWRILASVITSTKRLGPSLCTMMKLTLIHLKETLLCWCPNPNSTNEAQW